MAPIRYPIVETFHSLQGEGTWTGANAFFIRLGGCDVGCPWCDTKESWPLNHHRERAIASLLTEAQAAGPAFVVITGGEPLMHNLEPLTTALHSANLRVHLETSGAYPLSGAFDWITLSPKRFKPPDPEIYAQADELKIVVQDATDLTWAKAQAARVLPTMPAYLQPEWHSPTSQALIIDYVRHHPRWRMGLQTHKLLDVR